MTPSTPFSLKGQHHSTVLSPSLRPFSINGQHHPTVLCPPSIPLSLKGQHHSTVICPSLTPSQPKLSTTQLSYVPLRPLLPQRSAPLNFYMSPLYPFSLKDQYHSTVKCPPLALLNKRSAPLNCHMCPLYLLLPQRSASLNCHTPPLPSSNSKVITTQLSYAPLYAFSIKGEHQSTVICPGLYPLLPQSSASLKCHVPPLPPSQPKVSITQLTSAPLYPLLN